MTPIFAARRAAEEFDSVLSGTAGTEVTERHADLVDTVARIRAVPEVTPRPDFAADLRERLLLAAETDLLPDGVAPTPVRVPRESGGSRRHRRVATAAAALVLVGGSAGVAAAASGALPGDTLYPVKRGAEQVGEAVRLSEASKGRAELGQAENRLAEAGELMATSSDPALVAQTLASFRATADDGAQRLFEAYQADADAEDVAAVRSFASTQMAEVSRLAETADPATSSMLLHAADTLTALDQQARTLCSTCGADSTLKTPAALAEGASAPAIDTLLARPVTQARTDLTAAERAGLLDAAQRAQKSADRTPEVDPSSPGTTGSTTGSSSDPAAPLRSTVSADGELLPGIGGGRAVEDLVSGVTGTITGVTSGVPGAGQGLGKVTKKATDATKDLTDGVTGLTDGATGGVTGGVTDGVGGLTDGVTGQLLP